MMRALLSMVFSMDRTPGNPSWGKWRRAAVVCAALAACVAMAGGGGIAGIISRIMLIAVVFSASASVFGLPFSAHDDGTILRPRRPLLFMGAHVAVCVLLFAVLAMLRMISLLPLIMLLVIVIMLVRLL